MNDVSGKHIWIIGAGSGIGYALAVELAARGAHLILSSRNEDNLNALNDHLGGKHLVCPLDIADSEATKKVVSDIRKSCPTLDSAIFLAAIYSTHDGKPKDIDFIHETIHVNLGGAFNMLNAVQPVLEKQGHGQIVLCGSIAGYRGLPTGQPYCATKAGLISLAESLKLELEDKNIDVKVICPGFVKTPLTDKNDFHMPMIIEAEDAAKAIANGLTRRAFEIHFPKRMTLLMKLMRIVPNWLYFAVIRRVRP